MFCGKCGNKLPDNALFCDKCGQKTGISGTGNTSQQIQPNTSQQVQPNTNQQVQPNMSQQNAPKNKKNISRITIVLAVELVLLVAAVFFAYTKIKESTSPEMIAKSYFTAVMAGDTKRAYDLVDVDESDFVNEKYFGALLKDIGQQSVYNYKIDDTEDTKTKEADSQDIQKTIKITYRLKEDTSDYSFYVQLQKAASKKFLLFDDWKVNIGNHIQKDVALYVNQGSKVMLEGEEINEKYLAGSDETGEESRFEKYVIPKMFFGTYEALITNDLYADSKVSISVDEENNTFYPGYEDDDEDGENHTVAVKSEILEKTEQQAQKDFKALWDSAVQQKPFDSISDLTTAEDKSWITEEYENLSEKLKMDDGTGLEKITFENFVVTANADVYNDEKYPSIYVEFSAPYTCVSITRSWWTNATESHDSSGDYTGTMRYSYENGNWVLSSISIASFSYY